MKRTEIIKNANNYYANLARFPNNGLEVIEHLINFAELCVKASPPSDSTAKLEKAEELLFRVLQVEGDCSGLLLNEIDRYFHKKPC